MAGRRAGVSMDAKDSWALMVGGHPLFTLAERWVFAVMARGYDDGQFFQGELKWEK